MSAPATVNYRSATPKARDRRNPIKVVFLFTTFPKLSETFLQREIRAMQEMSIDLDLFSLWGGEAEFEGIAVNRFSKTKLVTLLWWVPYWAMRKPAAFSALFKRLTEHPVPSWKNLGETLLGISFAITHAALLIKEEHRPDFVHGVWATMPATAAQLLANLTGIPFSMGAHAYDIYQNGGDWLLPGKLHDAGLIVTSTDMAREELLRRGADPAKVVVVRRGLYTFPAFSAIRSTRSPLRILSVARLVEKKGIQNQLEIFAEMKRRNIPFEAHIVGDGPLAKRFRARLKKLDLADNVGFLGSLVFTEVLAQFVWADAFLFTGAVAEDGDRDGLPNVILEAMATGTPVVASKTAAVPELVEDGRNGVLLSGTNPDAWISALLRLRDDDAYYRRIRREGRVTVEEHGDARRNTKALLEHFCVVPVT